MWGAFCCLRSFSFFPSLVQQTLPFHFRHNENGLLFRATCSSAWRPGLRENPAKSYSLTEGLILEILLSNLTFTCPEAPLLKQGDQTFVKRWLIKIQIVVCPIPLDLACIEFPYPVFGWWTVWCLHRIPHTCHQGASLRAQTSFLWSTHSKAVPVDLLHSACHTHCLRGKRWYGWFSLRAGPNRINNGHRQWRKHNEQVWLNSFARISMLITR